MEDVIFTVMHLENKNTYARILLIDFSLAINTILPQQLIEKLCKTCRWILDFLMERQQTVSVGSVTSETTTASTGSPQGCVLSPLLFTLLTRDCSASFNTNHMIKFSEDTTVVSCIINRDELAYREEVVQLTA